MKIVPINGIARTGKTTFVEFTQKMYPRQIEITSIINDSKEIMSEWFGWKGTKTDKDRKCMSDLNDLLTWYNDIPVKRIKEEISWNRENNKKAVFIMAREPTDIQKFKDAYGGDCVTILLDRDVDSIPNNHADEGVYEYQYDYVIDNNSTLDALKESAKLFCKDIGL